ncbi:hypothetical protein [Cryobacterium arcticum]|uniref:CD-NTase-associated protein 12/Pycsar effector protein TIR domain-containing protein n=1 Tax=Cryobacterium arcticum TaxID=670052 RepID=A0A317ZPU3_9MICO|nr:hypothetical protein [Cryobacterium arcticum]PXA68522.1 hypothetical protein CTB96_18195 [Cryobacterium arcticum]
MSHRTGNMTDSDETILCSVVDEFAEAVEVALEREGINIFESPLWRPWNLLAMTDRNKAIVVFERNSGGFTEFHLMQDTVDLWSMSEFTKVMKLARQRDIEATVQLPWKSSGAARAAQIKKAVQSHVDEVKRSQTLGRLSGTSGLEHLQPNFERFLRDHPEPSKNFFVMMSFNPSPQLEEVYASIAAALHDRGLHCVRADQKDYADDLWANIEVYLTCCNFGIAVYEDMHSRSSNPNVALEVGYMMAKQKRVLLLKEKGLPTMPSDLAHKLYKSFDAFQIQKTVTAEVTRWVDTDLD